MGQYGEMQDGRNIKVKNVTSMPYQPYISPISAPPAIQKLQDCIGNMYQLLLAFHKYLHDKKRCAFSVASS